MTFNPVTPFNSALEAGVRSVAVLGPSFPRALDLQRLVAFDYVIVHTGDTGGPDSLHPQLPLRAAELLVRREVVERGLLLMISRGLIERSVSTNGILYQAGDLSETFLSTLVAPYLVHLRGRGNWVVEAFGELDDETLRGRIRQFFGEWIAEFQAIERSLIGET